MIPRSPDVEITLPDGRTYRPLRNYGGETRYPALPVLRDWLRWPVTGGRIRQKLLAAYVVGSEARQCAKPDSDLDIAVVIAPVTGKSALQFTMDINERFEQFAFLQRVPGETAMPHYKGRRVDIMFFYNAPGKGGVDDLLPDHYDKIPLTQSGQEETL